MTAFFGKSGKISKVSRRAGCPWPCLASKGREDGIRFFLGMSVVQALVGVPLGMMYDVNALCARDCELSCSCQESMVGMLDRGDGMGSSVMAVAYSSLEDGEVAEWWMFGVMGWRMSVNHAMVSSRKFIACSFDMDLFQKVWCFQIVS